MNGRKQKGFKKDGESEWPSLHSVQKKWVTDVRTNDKKKRNIRKKEVTKINKVNQRLKVVGDNILHEKIPEWEKAQ